MISIRAITSERAQHICNAENIVVPSYLTKKSWPLMYYLPVSPSVNLINFFELQTQ